MKDKTTWRGNTSGVEWLENKLRHIDFKDKRPVDRIIKTANFWIARHPVQ